MRMGLLVGLAACSVGLVAGGAGGQVIGFELLPNGTPPTDNEVLPITSPYIVGGIEVRFGFDTNGDGDADTPGFFEAVGPDGTDAFTNNTDAPGQTDTPRAEFADRIGSFFLRSGAGVSVRDGDDFIVTYSTPVTALGGEIWDLESGAQGGERFIIRAFDVAGNEVASQTSPQFVGEDRRFDAAPWAFFLASGEGIVKLVFEFIGDTPFSVGFAFDNFNASASVAAPSVLAYTPQENDGVLRDPAGVDSVRLVFSEAVLISPSDVEVSGPFGAVPVTLSFESSQIVSVIFGDQLYQEVYTVRVKDSVRSLNSNAMLDGDADGNEGGDFVLQMVHACPADLAPPTGVLDVDDLLQFLDDFTMCR